VHQAPDVLLLEEPMRGVDVAAKVELRRVIDGFARAGKAVIVASSSEDDLLALCDTIAVMREGRIVATRATSAWTRSDLVRCVAGGGEAA
jgi:ABC-type sugar transport system ATPase subunit